MDSREASSQVYEGLRHRVAVDGAGLKASASSEARVPTTEPDSFDVCTTQAWFGRNLVVGAGTTGLAEGTPVRLKMAVVLKGGVTEDYAPTMPTFQAYTELKASAGVAQSPPGCDGWWYCGQFGADIAIEHKHNTYAYPSSSSFPNGAIEHQERQMWRTSSNISEQTGDDINDFSFPCEAWPSCPGWTAPPPRHDAQSGTRTVEFETRVGWTINVSGAINLSTLAAYGFDAASLASVDELRVLVEPAPGFEGIHLGAPGGDSDGGTTDTTPPAASATVSPDPNAAGWHRDDATISLSGTDDGHGVASITWSATGAQAAGPTTVPGDVATVLVTAEGETTITSTAADTAGNQSPPQTVTVRIDRTAPEVSTPTVAPDPNAAGWHTTSPTISLAASDALSGLAEIAAGTPKGAVATSTTSPVTYTVTDEGVTTVGWRAVDVAGNVATGAEVTVNVDRAAPSIRMAPVTVVAQTGDKEAAQPIPYQVDVVDAADPAPSVSCTPATPNQRLVVPQPASCAATDAAGHTSAPASGLLIVLPSQHGEALDAICAGLTTLESIFTKQLNHLIPDGHNLYLFIRAALQCGGDVSLPDNKLSTLTQPDIQEIGSIIASSLGRIAANVVSMIIGAAGGDGGGKGGSKG